MLRTFIRWPDGNTSHETDRDTLHRAVATDGTVAWIDMFDVTDDEAKFLTDVFHLHPLAIEDSLEYAQRPKIERYQLEDGPHRGKPYYYMVFHGPDLDSFRQKLRTKELDIFFSDRFLLTIHDEKFQSLKDLVEKCEQEPSRLLGDGIDTLLYHILDRITDYYQPILDYLEEAMDKLEDDALDNPRPELLGQISAKKRELLDLRRIVGPQREVVAQLSRGEVPIIRESTRVYFRDVQDHLIRINEMVELYRDLVLGARDIYLSSISNHLNQIMKTLTIISVIGLPMTIVTGFFGMNFDEAIFHSHRVFLGALLFMGIVVSIMLWLFKKNRWI